MPVLSQAAAWSLNRFETAAKLAISGNVIDSGANRLHGLAKRDLVLGAHRAMAEPLAGDPVGELEHIVQGAADILFIGDNAGECFLDTFLLDLIPGRKVTYAVRGSPVLNDATLEDARAAGIDRRCRLVDTGDDAPGVLLDRCSPEFREAFDQADLVILKGQGNYESLGDMQGKTCAFLTRVKCDVIARDTGHPVGANVVKIHNGFKRSAERTTRGAAQTRKEVRHA
jgi:uncharacterized protein with ATP-grasp and redox domains